MSIRNTYYAKITLTAGTGFRPDGTQIDPAAAERILTAFDEFLAERQIGFSRVSGRGGWYDADLRVYFSETNVTYTILVPASEFGLADSEDLTNHLAECLKARLGQSCVVRVLETINAEIK
jgi:hypothetical protein